MSKKLPKKFPKTWMKDFPNEFPLVFPKKKNSKNPKGTFLEVPRGPPDEIHLETLQ